MSITRADFGPDFRWGVVISAFQNEGAHDADGKGPSIWDAFTERRGKIKDRSHARTSTDFYNRYVDDILLARSLGFNVFRFSLSWPRIMPEGTGPLNPAGIAFYHRVLDAVLATGMEPYVTLYHWDLPLALEKKGGWCHRGTVHAFETYATACAREFGGKVRNWIVLNEPFGFTSLGYMLGVHAPGKFGLSYFLPAVHHVALAQAVGGRALRAEVPGARIGVAYSCSQIIPFTDNENDRAAAARINALFNRLFIEPALGMGYPSNDFPLLARIARRYALWRDWDQLPFDFDFIGIQNYFPLVVRYNAFMPYINASEVKARYRKVPTTALGWEISGNGLYSILQQFAAYPGVKEIMITEGGAAFADVHDNGRIHDPERIAWYEEYLRAALLARQSGVPLAGYFAWTLTDNFEWAEGYNARFGLVHVDLASQRRTVKSSGRWFSAFLEGEGKIPGGQ